MKLFKKIDLFYNGDYLCTTQQAKTCKEAVKRYIEKVNYYGKVYNGLVDEQIRKNPQLLKARFQ